MADLQAYVAEQKKGKGSFLGKSSSAASESDSDSAGLLSWMPSSVNISMPKVFGGEANNKSSDSTWFSEAKKDPMCPALSRTQRLIGFACCICGGIFCFSLASLYVPVLLLKARKFALLYSLGSLFMINSFSFLWGPWNHAKHLMTKERLPFTTAYFGSLFATLYFAMWLRSTLFTSIAAIVQIVALLWYLVSYIPGGQTGLSFISRLFTSAVTRTVSKSMPV